MNRRDIYYTGALGLIGLKIWNDMTFYRYTIKTNKEIEKKVLKMYQIIHSPYYLSTVPTVFKRMNDIILQYIEKNTLFTLDVIYQLCRDTMEIEGIIKRVNYASRRLLIEWINLGDHRFIQRDEKYIKEKREELEEIREEYRMKIPLLYIEKLPMMNFMIDFALLCFIIQNK